MFILSFLESFGKYVMMLRQTIAKPEKFSMYWRETMRQMYDIGVGSFWIIAIVSIFIGAVTSVQFSYKFLEIKFIPMWWLGSIIRDSMMLELAPTITALLLAGKIGSNIASELGTMRVYEQIDAMDIMGVNTHAFLIGPKILGGLLIVPALVFTAMLLGTYGGMLAGEMGGFYTRGEYIYGLQDEFRNEYLRVMIVKSFVFPFIITSVSCFKGFYVKGGSKEIGQASTEAVVMSSILVVIANFIIAFLLL